MGFLTPWFLAAGAVAAGIPLYFHLLRAHKAKQVPFSSLMFFERRTQSSIKQRRLQYYLLFALRLSLVVLLALAFAAPYITRAITPASSGQKLHVFVVDQSFSMREGNHLDEAKRAALADIGKLGGSDKAQVLGAGTPVRIASQVTNDKGELQSAVTGMEQTDSQANFGELSRVLRNVAQSAKMPLDVQLYSDLQQTGLPANFNDLKLANNTQITFHPVAKGARPNWTVENVMAPAMVYSGKKIRVTTTVAGTHTQASNRTVSLVMNGRTLESKPVAIPTDGRATVEFPTIEVPYGLNRGEIRIEPADALAADDHFYFSIERGEPRKILFVHEARDSRSPLYYQTALESGSESAFTIDSATSDQVSNLDLKKYALAVLSDAGGVSSGFQDNLRRYVQGGAAALLVAGPSMSARGKMPVWGGTLEGSRYSGRGAERFQTVANMDAEHPSIRKANHWEGVKFYQTFAMDPGNARVIAKLSDGSPLLLEQRMGEGRVLVFASPLDNVANDFPIHPSYVPFVEQTARYLAGMEEKQANVAVDSVAELRSAKEQGTAVEVTGPDGKRALSLRESTTATTLPLTREGFYEIRRSNGRQELVAVHADRKESDLDVIPEETLKLWQATGSEPVSNTADPSGQTYRSNLWWYVMLLVLLLAVAEALLGDRYLGVEREMA